MAAMTDVPVPQGATWTLIYTAGATVTITIQARDPAVDLLVRVNGSSGATSDDVNSAAELLRPYERVSMTLANGDKVFAKTLVARDGRATVRA